MLNRYPFWKNLLIVIVLFIGALYALPNLYPKDPAVQVSSTTGEIDPGTQGRIEKALEDEGIAHEPVEQEGDKLLIRLTDEETQLKAADALKLALSSRNVVALNLAHSTPGWLRFVNALPMNLGLDLRGGVYFLLEVDMDAAVT
ncbi:MAG: protein translocase subunit SecD, partial [Gammaproteobacteria bacterium]